MPVWHRRDGATQRLRYLQGGQGRARSFDTRRPCQGSPQGIGFDAVTGARISYLFAIPSLHVRQPEPREANRAALTSPIFGIDGLDSLLGARTDASNESDYTEED